MADTLPRLSVVIPLYMEEDNVERLIDELHSALEPYPGEFEFVLVDDGSTDRTRELLVEARANRGDYGDFTSTESRSNASHANRTPGSPW